MLLCSAGLMAISFGAAPALAQAGRADAGAPVEARGPAGERSDEGEAAERAPAAAGEAAARPEPAPEVATGRESPEESRREASRRLFEEATVAFGEGRLAEAQGLFRAAIERYATTSAAYNLAMAHREAGDYTTCLELLLQLLEGRFGSLPPARREEVKVQRERVRRWLAGVRVHLGGGAPVATVRLDGRLVGQARPDQPLDLDVNPGEHFVSAQVEGGSPQDRRVEVTRGEQRALRFDLEPPPEAERASLWTSPWLWVGAGLVIAGAVVGAVLAVKLGDDLPEDNVFGTVETLRVGF